MTTPTNEYADLAAARTALSDLGDGFYLTSGVTLPYRVIPKPAYMTERVIDLRRRYDISLTKLPNGEWLAIDRVTFDDDPEARLHVRGVGSSTTEAVTELLEKLAEVALDDGLDETGPDHVRPMMNCPREEPPEFGKSRAETYREEEDGRDE